jgi:regulator of sirC expression with transglutaminase-like and TPR domain
VNVQERFAAAVAGEVQLDVAAFSIAACAHPALDVDAACEQLDLIAGACPSASFAALHTYCFETLKLSGNRYDYGDPENSFLDSVLERRRGIPITLAVAMMEIGRRIGVGVFGVGMPGHFLARDARRDEEWCDPFNGGALYDADDCRALFARVHRSADAFSIEMLQPTPPRAIVARMLMNLEHGRLASDPTQLAWMCDLHLSLPGLAESEQRRLTELRQSVRARWN